MKKILLLSLFISYSSLLSADHHEESIDLSGAMTTINLIAKNPSAYIAQLKSNTDMMSASGTLLAGACIAVSGNEVPGEMQVFNFYSSMEAAFAGYEVQISNAGMQDFISDLNDFRVLKGWETSRVVMPYEGEVFDTFATRTLFIDTDNPQAYLEAVANLKEAYHANGYEDISLDVYQPIGAGNDPSDYQVTAVAPDLARLGAMFDALYSTSWAQEAFSGVAASRSAYVSDKIYKCETVYQSM